MVRKRDDDCVTIRGNDWMNGTNPKYDTICDQGCAMSSISMMLNGKGYTIGGQSINPGKG
jgi:hypothetical protein